MKAGSCTGFIQDVEAIVKMVFQSPISYSIFASSQAVLSVDVTCSEGEKVALVSLGNTLEDAIGSVENEETHIKSIILGTDFIVHHTNEPCMLLPDLIIDS